MVAVVKRMSSDPVVVDVVGDVRKFLNEQYSDNFVTSVLFYRYRNGVCSASVDFLDHLVTIRHGVLSVPMQKKFLGFIQDHLSEDYCSSPFGLAFIEKLDDNFG